MSEEKRNREADEERPPKPDGQKSAAERRSEERRAARERAAKAKEAASKPKERSKPAPKPKDRPVSKARERRDREAKKGTKPLKPAKRAKESPSPRKRPSPTPAKRRPPARTREDGPGAARLFALLAGAFLALLGVLGFFYDATFDTGLDLSSDDLAGTLMVNGWRNVIYLGTGIAALAFAARRPRITALALGLFYLGFAIWGFIVTERGIGDILDFLPLGNDDNALHLIIGVLGLLAALVDGPLPEVPESIRKRFRGLAPKPRKRRAKRGNDRDARSRRGLRRPRPDSLSAKRPVTAKPKPDAKKPPAKSARGSRDRSRAAPRRDGDDEPR